MTETRKSIDSNGLIHFSEGKKAEMTVNIENQTELDKDEVWNELKRGIGEQFQKRGITYDINTIQTKSDLDNAGHILNDLENKEKSEANLYKSAPTGGDTANVYSSGQQGFTYQSDSEGLPVDMIQAETPQQLIQILNSRKDPEAKQALNKMNAKLVRGKLIDMEFQGSSKDFLRNEKKINEFDSAEVKQQKEQFNNNLRKNRTNWRHTFE